MNGEKLEKKNTGKSGKKGSGAGPLALFLLVLILSGFSQATDTFQYMRPLIFVMVAVTVFALVQFEKKKKAAGQKPGAAAVGKRRPHEEQAVTCSHKTGKEKYMEQLDSFYRAGLIDRAEYKTLRERYARLELPEDYH